MEHHCDAQSGLQMSDCQVVQRLTGSRKERVEDRTGSCFGERAKLTGQRKNKVKVGHRQQLFLAPFNPLLLGQRLALGAMPVATGVVGGMAIATSLAIVDVSTEGRRATE